MIIVVVRKLLYIVVPSWTALSVLRTRTHIHRRTLDEHLQPTHTHTYTCARTPVYTHAHTPPINSIVHSGKNEERREKSNDDDVGELKHPALNRLHTQFRVTPLSLCLRWSSLSLVHSDIPSFLHRFVFVALLRSRFSIFLFFVSSFSFFFVFGAFVLRSYTLLLLVFLAYCVRVLYTRTYVCVCGCSRSFTLPVSLSTAPPTIFWSRCLWSVVVLSPFFDAAFS